MRLQKQALPRRELCCVEYTNVECSCRTFQSVGHAEFQSDWRCLGGLSGVPFSKLSGDKWEGEVGAIETAQIKHKCMVAGEQQKQGNDKEAKSQVQVQAAQPASGKN
ncbi:MAG TPA: hypothetical protein VFF26_13180 [Gallionella sp.]|nr:hypothetical protein [Gallionella sp.]